MSLLVIAGSNAMSPDWDPTGQHLTAEQAIVLALSLGGAIGLFFTLIFPDLWHQAGSTARTAAKKLKDKMHRAKDDGDDDDEDADEHDALLIQQ